MSAPTGRETPQRRTATQHRKTESLARRPAPPIGGPITLQIKVFSDEKAVSVGDGRFIFAVTQDMDGHVLISAEAYVTTVGTAGTALIQIRNVSQAADMLSTRISIDANKFHSKDATTQPVIDTANDDVAFADRIAVDVDAITSGSKGLGVNLTFAPGT